jgi:4-alpha-glucanotransferase
MGNVGALLPFVVRVRTGRCGGGGGLPRPFQANHGGVTEREILSRARAAGISPTYENWLHERVEVSPDTLEALLAALDRTAPAGVPAAVPIQAVRGGEPRIPALPAARTWGFTVQLYSVRSRQSWGHGDLHDLGDLAAWSARELGAGFVLVNPLHAAEPVPPISPSPYLPTTRMFTSPLYLRVEDIEEYRQLDPAGVATVEVLAGPLRERGTTADLIDRDAVWRAKRAALELVRQVGLSPQRQTEFNRYLAERGSELEHWSAWSALAEEHGPDWRSWPAKYSTPAQALAAVATRPELRERASFHSWLQWQCEQQLAQAQRRARQAGMPHGIIHDLAVGVRAGGADAWAHPHLLVAGVSVGAPPDSFNQLGQDWGMPPWHPQQLAAADYRPLADLFGASLRHAGGLRVDHVMGLTRLWWVPAGRRPDQGAYVSYDPEASVDALAGQAALAGAIAIGEDLGTVDPWVSTHLADHHILGTMMLWFASQPDGTPLRPASWRRACMATVGTHDVPPVAGFVTGDQVTVRAELGLLNQPLESERAQARLTLDRWRAALAAEGLLPSGGPPPGPAEFTVALYGYLSLTPSLLAGVSLADAVGDVRTQNIPGTSTEYPNWQIPLCDAAGNAVLLEDLGSSQLLRATVAAVRS